MHTRDIPIDEIVQRYQAGDSASVLAREFKSSVWAIITRLRKNGVAVRSAKEQNARYVGDRRIKANFNALQEILDGVLLSDGYIHRKGGLYVEQAWARVGWLEYLVEQLRACGCESRLIEVPPKDKFLKAENRIIHGHGGKVMYTPCYEELKECRRRWYLEGKKCVPTDLVLTPMSLAQWLCGDGSLSNFGWGVVLYTNGFTESDVHFLIEVLLRDLGIKSTLKRLGRNKEPVIQVHGKEDAFRLAKIVLPYVPECCRYKVPGVGCPNSGARTFTSEEIQKILELRETGFGYAKIGEQFGVGGGLIHAIVNAPTHLERYAETFAYNED